MMSCEAFRKAYDIFVQRAADLLQAQDPLVNGFLRIGNEHFDLEDGWSFTDGFEEEYDFEDFETASNFSGDSFEAPRSVAEA